MTDFAKSMAGAAVGMGALGLAVNAIPDMGAFGGPRRKKKKHILKTGVETLVGLGILKGSASIVNAM